MRHFHLKRNVYHKPSINLDRIWSLVSEQTRLNYKDKKDGPVPVIDVVKAVSTICPGKKEKKIHIQSSLFQLITRITVEED